MIRMVNLILTDEYNMTETDDAILRQEMLDKLNHAVPVVIPVEPVPVVVNDVEDDYNYTREKLKNLVAAGEEAIEHFGEIAKETSEPRAFEVLATLLKTTGELVTGVMSNHEAKANIESRKAQKTVGDKNESVTNNTTIFVGTTRELLDRINQESKVIEAEVKEIV